MSLTILSVAYPFAPVTARTAGGAEQVLSHLDRALVARGHNSLVIAVEGSSVAGQLLSIPAHRGIINDDSRSAIWQTTKSAIERCLSERHVDAIHMHGIDFRNYLPETSTPVLITLHLPPSWYSAECFCLPGNVYLHCVSESQQAACPPSSDLLPPIPNGVDLRWFRPAGRKRNYLFAMGRICPEKGFDAALDAATGAGLPLILAGEVFAYPRHLEYFQNSIQPRLAQEAHKFIGPVGPERKRRLLAGARCVLIPSHAPETSSLVAMEALACGTPVIAFPSGALKDLIIDGLTGFLVDSVDSMAAAVARTAEIDSADCRRYAEVHFDLERTMEEYLRTYEQIRRSPAARKPLSLDLIQTPSDLHALEPEWLNLYQQTREAPPFLHPCWQLTWWDLFGTAELHTLAVRRDGRLTALAACFRYQDRLVFLGNGITDQLGILSEDPDSQKFLLNALSRYKLDLQELPLGSPLLGFPHSQCSVSPAVKLTGNLPKDVQRNIRAARRMLEKTGVVSESVSGSPESLNDLFRLHAARWHERGESGMLADARVEEFHRRAAAGLSEAGLLRMHTLNLNSQVIGVVYAFARNGTVYSYLGGFDPALKDCSPGTVTIASAIGYARETGDDIFDLLRGSEKYKYALGAEDRPQFRIWT